MVDEITDYEVLEIAVRELAIEHRLFTPRITASSPNGPKRSDQPRVRAWSQKHGPTRHSKHVCWRTPPRHADRHRLGRTDRFWHA